MLPVLQKGTHDQCVDNIVGNGILPTFFRVFLEYSFNASGAQTVASI
ncbi:hypothetical protein [Endozoicomonas sp. ALC013]